MKAIVSAPIAQNRSSLQPKSAAFANENYQHWLPKWRQQMLRINARLNKELQKLNCSHWPKLESRRVYALTVTRRFR